MRRRDGLQWRLRLSMEARRLPAVVWPHHFDQNFIIDPAPCLL